MMLMNDFLSFHCFWISPGWSGRIVDLEEYKCLWWLLLLLECLYKQIEYFVFVLFTCFQFTYLSIIGSLQVFFEAGSYYFWNCDLQEAWSTVKHRPWTKQAQDLNSIFATYCTGSMNLQALWVYRLVNSWLAYELAMALWVYWLLKL